MFEKFEKFNTNTFTEYIHLLILSLFFGVSSFLFKVRSGKATFTGFNAISELTFSLISAYLSFRICLYFDVKEDLMWVFVGMAAWSGTRFIIKVENILDKTINDKFNYKEEDKSVSDNKE